jgi:hypothetical protein
MTKYYTGPTNDNYGYDSDLCADADEVEAAAELAGEMWEALEACTWIDVADLEPGDEVYGTSASQERLHLDSEPETVIGSKDDAQWEPEATASCVTTYPTDDGEGACDVLVLVGSSGLGVGQRWFVRTSDDAGGSDEADDTAYATRKEAVEAAEELADRLGEGGPGEDAEDYLARKLTETAGEPVADGEWCVYWETSLNDAGPRERYDSEDAATAAAEIANKALHAANPGGNLLCGFEVRKIVDGEWVREIVDGE